MKQKRIILLLATFFLIITIGYFVVKKYQSSKIIIKPVSQSKTASTSAVLSFAVIGDPESDLANLEKALNMIKKQNLEFTVLVGDLTSTGTPKQFEAIKKILDNSQVQYYVIPGNHDLWYEKKEKIDIYRQYFGSRFLSQDFNSYRFFFLDNSDEWLGMGSEQLNWFNQSFTHLSIIHDPLSIIFLHIPLYHPESQYIMGYREEKVKEEAKQLLDQLCQKPPLAIFSGHLHHTNQFEYKCANANVLKMISAGSVSSKRNWQAPRFLKVEVFGSGQLEIKEIKLES